MEGASKSQESGIGSIVASHYNNLENNGKEARKVSRIYHMRNFNNWIKSMLVNEFSDKVKRSKFRTRDRDGHVDLSNAQESFTVLDIGCGKGGDLLKWSKANIDHIVAVDIAETSVEQAKMRYREMEDRNRNRRIFSADFFAADCTKAKLADLYPNKNITFDIVSCQFAFHYCFESYEQADQMLENISTKLRPGGFFIGTTPDANDIVARVREGRASNSVFGLSFEDKMDEDVTPPLFGAKYNFRLEGVVDCPEFLVHFPTFVKLAEKHGLMLIMQRRFDSYFQQWKDNEFGGPLLRRMNALETFYRKNYRPLAGGDANDSGQYESARKFLADNPDQNSVDTLSKDEWEALTIYLAYAFKKMK